jgi:putative phage-type endonuclease
MIIEQRSPEWFEIRKGKITSSEIHKIMGKEGFSETAKTYLLEKVSEQLGGTSANATGPALEWGTQWEPVATEHYADTTNTKVDTASFIVYNDDYGGSPDGKVAPDGTIEVKCPHTSVKHFKHGLIRTDADFKKTAPDYYYQCMSHMICANAQWCDFISFDPRVDSKYTIFVYRLNRNEEEIKNMLARVEVAANYMKEVREKLQNADNKLITEAI